MSQANLVSAAFRREDIMPYGNYWIAECLYRELSDDWSVLALNSQA